MHQVTNLESLVSPKAFDWLSFKPSLTNRLRAFTNNRITFQVISEGWSTDTKEKIWQRKIRWVMDGNCWIEADLTIPHSSINTETQCLLATHERPIGEQLFQEPSLKRSDFLYFKADGFWIRESVFHYKNQPITLKETFFPAFFNAIQ